MNDIQVGKIPMRSQATPNRAPRRALACLALFLWAGSMTGGDREWVRPRPAEEFPELTSDGAWCWFGDPRAVRFQGGHDRIYAGWVDSEGSIVVSSLDLETGERA